MIKWNDNTECALKKGVSNEIVVNMETENLKTLYTHLYTTYSKPVQCDSHIPVTYGTYD